MFPPCGTPNVHSLSHISLWYTSAHLCLWKSFLSSKAHLNDQVPPPPRRLPCFPTLCKSPKHTAYCLDVQASVDLSNAPPSTSQMNPVPVIHHSALSMETAHCELRPGLWRPMPVLIAPYLQPFLMPSSTYSQLTHPPFSQGSALS